MICKMNLNLHKKLKIVYLMVFINIIIYKYYYRLNFINIKNSTQNKYFKEFYYNT